jgi:hypothetical protein
VIPLCPVLHISSLKLTNIAHVGDNRNEKKYAIDGERGYRTSKGLATPVGGLPIHVKLRTVSA